MRTPGVIDNLLLREVSETPVAPGDVLVEVHAVGLNFRDVMAATGLLPAEAEDGPAWERLGFECAGIVRAVGEGVDPALIGKRVAAVDQRCLCLACARVAVAGVRAAGQLCRSRRRRRCRPPMRRRSIRW